MSMFRRCLICALLLVPAVFAGCETIAEERHNRRVTEGGFTVLVDGSGSPTAAQVTADIGAFAQARGFSRQPAQSGPPTDPVTREPIPHAPDRYARGTLELAVSYQPTTHRVSAYLHDPSSTRERKLILQFYRDFHKEFGPRYGQPDPISESAFSGDQPNVNDGDSNFTPGINDTRSVGMGRGT